MGYDSRLSGHLAIDPPLPWTAVKNSPLYGDESRILRYQVKAEFFPQDNGDELVRRTAVGVEPATADQVTAYSLEEDLAAFVQEIRDHGSTARGQIVRRGEDTGDVERYIVEPGWSVRSERARLTWPDGTEVEW